MRIFITGITGTLGTALATLHYERGDSVWGCAKSENRTAKWMRDNYSLGTVFVGCCSNLTNSYSDIGRVLRTVDRLYHCAAMKHVDLCEKNIAEAIWQNITVTQKVVQASIAAKVPLVFISSDKVCMPDSVYGCTKLIGERMVLANGQAVVRLGNIIGSSGSVFEKWATDIRSGRKLQITDPSMTRYFISQKDAAEFVVDQHCPGVVVVPYLLSAEMGELADAICKCGLINRHKVEVTGKRLGESRHQWLAAPGSIIIPEDHRILLPDPTSSMATGHSEDNLGLSSDTAVRWHSQALLQVAGLL